MIDVLIVGQGIAGSVLALELLKRDRTVHIIDRGDGASSSAVAAGVINPITGRRLVRSWKAGEIIPEAVEFYRAAERILGASLITEHNLVWGLSNEEMLKQWMLREGDPVYSPYFIDHSTVDVPNALELERYGCLTGVFHLDMPGFILRMAKFLTEKSVLFGSEFNFNQLVWTASGLEYDGQSYRCVVFCEGYYMRNNPYFTWLPAETAKGEAVICRIPELALHAIVKSKVTIVPLEQDRYWVGSTYDWEDTRPDPTKRGLQTLTRGLDAILKVPFVIEEHLAAIRPTAKDRRPFVGPHPEHSQLAILNGLGTKGASLAPFCARVLADNICDARAIPAEVDILRCHIR